MLTDKKNLNKIIRGFVKIFQKPFAKYLEYN